MAACDHSAWIEAQTKLAALREEAFQTITPIVNRLVKSLNDELNVTALAAEQRLDSAGLPIRAGATWLLHDDVVCEALWSCRSKAEKLLAELSPEIAIGCVQWFLTPEEHTSFQWALNLSMNYGVGLVRSQPGSIGLDPRHAARAWEVALRLKEQAARLGVVHGINQSLPESALDLQALENQIQVAAKRLANATGISATSLECLIDELSRFGTGATYLRAWQY